MTSGRGRTKSSVRPIAGRAGQSPAPEVEGAEAPGTRAERRRERSRGRRASDATAPIVLPKTVPPILLATADPALSTMISFALRQMRYEFTEINTGPETLRELSEMQVGTQPPVVVLDVDLPGMDGHAILERIGALRPDTFLILVLSSHADESVQVRSLLAGAVDHMPKPFNVRILMAKIHRWVAMSARLAATV